MAEEQKDYSASAKLMEKTSLPDLDIGKDFLTSGKSMSVTEDDPMDFDFSKVRKGNKNAFKFENLDMDFNPDNDFGKISSFNVDIPDLDVSFPVKKSAQPNEKSKEVSMDEKTQGKSNRSTFQFDFNEFDDLSFGPSLMKKAKQTNANHDAELSLSPSGSLGLKETVRASESETTSKFDSQLCAEANSRSKEKLQTPLVEVHIPSKSEISKDQATNVGATTSPQRPNSNSTQETFQDNRPKERISSVEPYAKDKRRNSSVQSVSENSSTDQTDSNLQEEFGCLAGKKRTNAGSEQSLSHDKTDIGIDCGDSQIDKLPVDMAGSQGNNGVNSQFSGDNPVRVDTKYNADQGQGDSQYEQTSTSASKQVLRETEADGETMDFTLELVMQSNSETTGGDREMPDPNRVTEVVRSKYFKGSDEAKSQLQKSSLSQTKIAIFDSKRIETMELSCSYEGATMDDKGMPDEESLPNIRSESFKGVSDTKSHPQQESLSQVVGSIGSQRITTSLPCTADERKLDDNKVQSGNKFIALPKPKSPLAIRLVIGQASYSVFYIPLQPVYSLLLNKMHGVRKITSSVERCSQVLHAIYDRGRSNSYDTRRILTSTSRLHDMDVAKGVPVPNGSENNLKDLNAFRKLHGTGGQSGRKSVVLLKAVPREQIDKDSVRTRSEGSFKELTNNRGGCNSENTGRTLTGTSMRHDHDAAKGEVVLDGSKKNMKYLNTLSSHAETSGSNEPTNRYVSLLGLNPKLQVSGMKSTHNKINYSRNKEDPHLKDNIRASILTNLNNMRTKDTIHTPSKSILQKDTKLVTNLGQGADLKENTGPRMAHHADTREQALLSPTLKRKNIEESSANLVMLKPTKRLFLSPGGSRNFRESSEKLVDKKNLPDGNTEKVLNDSKSSCLHLSQKVDMKEQETPLEMENDTNVENVDACAKELDNLVNMLKKKHEEAKEILVRAVVNNNKLLMLNHPIYEEKFRMIEKFGALWLSK